MIAYTVPLFLRGRGHHRRPRRVRHPHRRRAVPGAGHEQVRRAAAAAQPGRDERPLRVELRRNPRRARGSRRRAGFRHERPPAGGLRSLAGRQRAAGGDDEEQLSRSAAAVFPRQRHRNRRQPGRTGLPQRMGPAHVARRPRTTGARVRIPSAAYPGGQRRIGLGGDHPAFGDHPIGRDHQGAVQRSAHRDRHRPHACRCRAEPPDHQASGGRVLEGRRLWPSKKPSTSPTTSKRSWRGAVWRRSNT